MSTPLTKGQRVMTKLGPGTILGFEHLYLDTNRAVMLDEDLGNNSRVCVHLDTPENWLLHKDGGDPFFVRSDLWGMHPDD